MPKPLSEKEKADLQKRANENFDQLLDEWVAAGYSRSKVIWLMDQIWPEEEPTMDNGHETKKQ